jgi:hypothetical protein
MYVGSVVALLAFSPAAFGIVFPGPAPTAVGNLFNGDLTGRSPKPTGRPLSLPELFGRQQTDDDGVCGYLEGDGGMLHATTSSVLTDSFTEAQMSCAAGASCLYDDELSWFGCCTGTARSECQLFTTCVGAASISSCAQNSACVNDDYALGCAESTAAFCMTLLSGVEEGTVTHYMCGPSSTRALEVIASATTTGESDSASGSIQSSSPTVVSSSAGSMRSSATQQEASSLGLSSHGSASASQMSSAGATSATGASRVAASTAQSTAGAMKTAQAVIGAAGGFAGVVALLL